MQVVTTDKNLREAIGNRSDSSCGFVPTMGALHEGHLALIRRAVELAGTVVVSIFVNPTQFGPGEDFQKYPRTLEADLLAAEQAGADIVFTPDLQTMYPGYGTPTGVTVDTPPLPATATEPALEDYHRPGHFAGVCQVVARLFDLVMPRFAVFGEKDYQQLLVLSAMVRANDTRWPHLQVIAHPTLRDDDGLAMSSRNRYLTPAQRQRALSVSRALQTASDCETAESAESAMRSLLLAQNLVIDYAVVRHARTLMPLRGTTEPARALIAARVDSVRLIDNAPVAIGTRPDTSYT